MSKAKTSTIYALCEPGTRTVRYIGKTNNLKRRLREHLVASLKKRNHLGNWLRSLASRQEIPVLVALHEVAKNECPQEEERRYISCARALGMTLVNGTDGGEGGLGRVVSPDTRTAISISLTGRSTGPKSPEHRAAISAALKGLPRSTEHCAAISAAKLGVPQTKPRSPEQCAAIGARQKGVPKSPEHRAAMSAARKGVSRGPWSPARRAAYERGKLAKG